MAEEVTVPVTQHTNPKVVAFTHYITALVMLLKGLTKIDYWPAYSAFVILSFVAAALILGITVFHHWLSHRIRHLNVFLYVTEAIVIGSIAYITLSTSWVQAAIFALASLLFLVSCFVQIWGEPKRKATFSGSGIRIWLSPFRRYHFKWAELEQVSLQPHLQVLTRTGQKVKAVLPEQAPLAELQAIINKNLLPPKPASASVNHA